MVRAPDSKSGGCRFESCLTRSTHDRNNHVANPKELAERSVHFLQEVWTELKKVHWPSLRETRAATVVVILVVFVIAAFLGAVDFALSQVVEKLLSPRLS